MGLRTLEPQAHGTYVGRRPEKTLLYKLIQKHWQQVPQKQNPGYVDDLRQDSSQNKKNKYPKRKYTWARLLKCVFNIDIETCPHFGH